MRTLLLVLLLTTMGCVTVDGPKRLLGEKQLDARCDPGPPVALLDGEVRDRVRLVFSQAQHCTERWDVTYSKDQRTRLSDAARGVIAGGAGLIVAIPLTALALFAGTRYPSANWGSAGEPLGYGIGLLAVTAGVGAHEALGSSDPRPAIEVTERITRPRLGEQVVKQGWLHGSKLPVGGLPVSADGTLELSLDEAQGLSEGELYLDGARVALGLETRERLSFLSVCKEAVDGFDAGLASWSHSRRAVLWKLAEACDRRGWTFAEEVRLTAIAPQP